MKGDRRPRISFTSHVGMGSREHVLHGAAPISDYIIPGESFRGDNNIIIINNYRII